MEKFAASLMALFYDARNILNASHCSILIDAKNDREAKQIAEEKARSIYPDIRGWKMWHVQVIKIDPVWMYSQPQAIEVVNCEPI